MKFQFFEIKRAEINAGTPFGRVDISFHPLLKEPLEFSSGEAALSRAYERFENLGRRIAVQEIYVRPNQNTDTNDVSNGGSGAGQARSVDQH